jgi:hypothetical protein
LPRMTENPTGPSVKVFPGFISPCSVTQALRGQCKHGPMWPGYHSSWWKILVFTHDDHFEGMYNLRVSTLWRLPYRFQRRAGRLGNVWQGQNSCKHFLRSQFVKLWEGNLSFSSDPRMLETPGTCNVCWWKPQANSLSSPSEIIWVTRP